MWLSKPKNKDTETPHFEENRQILSVHQDSSDNTKYREMKNPSMIGSVFLPSGTDFISLNQDGFY